MLVSAGWAGAAYCLILYYFMQRITSRLFPFHLQPHMAQDGLYYDFADGALRKSAVRKYGHGMPIVWYCLWADKTQLQTIGCGQAHPVRLSIRK